MRSQSTPIGERAIIVTGKCTQLTIAITGGVTILRMGTKQCGASRKICWFYPNLWNFWGTLVANEVKKNYQVDLFGDKKAIGAVTDVPYPSYVHAYVKLTEARWTEMNWPKGTRARNVIAVM